MNISAKAILTVSFAAAVQFAAPACHAHDTLTMNCAAPRLPSQQAVAKALDLHNFDQVYRARDELMRVVQRACRNGATQVLVSNDSPESPRLGWSYTGPRMAKTQ
ncbi:MAG: hypothetical protein ABI178_15410 [Rhodanobacter sp.]